MGCYDECCPEYCGICGQTEGNCVHTMAMFKVKPYTTRWRYDELLADAFTLSKEEIFDIIQDMILYCRQAIATGEKVLSATSKSNIER